MSDQQISWEDFARLDIRSGTIISAEVFKEARKPAYKLQVDFGPMGIRKTSAQIKKLYSVEELPGKQVLAVVNFPPKQIANFMSECLVLGTLGEDGEVTLLTTDKDSANGSKVG